MDNKTIAIIAVIAVAVVGIAAFALMNNGGSSSDEREPLSNPITVSDALGNQVTIDYKVKRVALTELAHVELFATVYGEGWEDLVCMMPEDISSRDASLGAYIEKNYPSLTKLPTCPDLYTGLATNPTLIAEKILDTNPDLVILPGATVMWIPGLESFFKLFSDSDIPVFNSTFYTYGLSDTIAGLNYGSLGKVFGKESRANEIVSFYNSSLKMVKDRLALKDTASQRIYYEVPSGVDMSVYGSVVNMGVPEVELTGYNILKESGVPMDAEFNLQKMIEGDPDWIFIVDTAYYGGNQILGYYMEDVEDKAQASLENTIKSRAGWSDLDAVKEGKVVLMYGECRFSITDLYNLYAMASIIYDDVVTEKDMQNLMAGFSKYLPWEFKGTFVYQIA